MKKLNRYAGVAPFSDTQKDLFFGRENDTEKLCSLILQEQQVLLYAKSGLGKSSIINAGIVPRLKASHQIEPIFVRFGNYTEQKKETLIEILLQSLPTHHTDTFLDKIITQENSLWYHLKSLQIENDNTKYLLIFDQFEEIFTYPEEQIFIFKKQMADMLYRNVPKNFKKVVEIKQAKEPHLLTEAENQLLHQKFEVKTLMAIREDKYSLLNTLTDYLPDVMHYRYGLEPLSVEQATQAITIPAQQKGDFEFEPFSYTPDALQKIIDFLTAKGTQAIETTQLQILCNRIENLQINLVKSANIPNFDNIFLEFYYDTLKQISENRQLITQKFIENQLIQEEKRISLDEVVCTKMLPQSILDALVRTHLLRVEPNTAGRFSYEVAHDTLISPIVEAKNIREAQEKAEQAEKDRIEEEKRLREQAERDKQEKLKIQKQLRKTRLVLAGVFSLLVMAVLAFIFAFWQMREASVAKDNAEKARKNAENAEKIAKNEKNNAENAEKNAKIAKENAEKAFTDLQKQMGITRIEQEKRTKAEDDAIKSKIKKLLDDADSLEIIGEYEAALEKVKEALKLSPSNLNLHNKIKNIKQLLKK